MSASAPVILQTPTNAGRGLKDRVVCAGVKHIVKAFDINKFPTFPLRTDLNKLGGIGFGAVNARIGD